MIRSRSARIKTLSLVTTLGLMGLATTACSSAPPESAAEPALRPVSGEVDVAAFEEAGTSFDNPVIIAQSEDDEVYATPIGPDGKWTILVTAGKSYRFLVANTPPSGTSYAIVSQILWKSQGDSSWVRCDEGDKVDTGKIKPKAPSGDCGGDCNGGKGGGKNGGSCTSGGCGGDDKGGGKGGDHDDDKDDDKDDKGGGKGGDHDDDKDGPGRDADGHPKPGECDDGRDWGDDDDDDYGGGGNGGGGNGGSGKGGTCGTSACTPDAGGGSHGGAGDGGKGGTAGGGKGGKGGSPDKHDKVCACEDKSPTKKPPVESECEGKKSKGVTPAKDKDRAKDAEKKMKERCDAKPSAPPAPPVAQPAPPGGSCRVNTDCESSCSCTRSKCKKY